MNEFIDYIMSHPYALKALWTVLWLIVTMIIIKVINRIMFKYIEDNARYYTARKWVYYVFSIIFIIIVVFTWGNSTDNLTTYIGLLSAGIAIALKELFSNMAGWLFIVIRKPFDVGHRIRIAEQQGDVIDIRMFQFSLMEVTEQEKGEQSTGRIIDVPNYFIFIHPVTNFAKGFKYIWNEINVLITFESDWQLAKELLGEIVETHTIHLSIEAKKKLREAARKYMIHYNKLTPIVYTDVRDSGVELTMRYLCQPKHRRTTNNLIWEDVLHMIHENDAIELAYPTMRITK